MYCSKCGKEINDSAIVCIHCGEGTANFQKQNQQSQPVQPFIINNSSSSSSSASAAASSFSGRVRRHYSLLLDIILFFCTGGLWIFWIIFRPKYY